MRIKKYVAKSMREALLRIKEELGEDAVILTTAKVPKGMFGLAGPDEIEVTAAVEDDAAPRKAPEFPPLRVAGASDKGLYGRPRPTPAGGAEPVKPELPEPPQPDARPYFQPRRPLYSSLQRDLDNRGKAGNISGIRDDDQDAGGGAGRGTETGAAADTAVYKRPPPPKSLPPDKRGSDDISEIRADVNELKDIVKSVLTAAAASAIGAPPGGAGANDAGWNALVKQLTDSEVKPDIAEKLVGSIRVDGQLSDPELEKKLEAALSDRFPVSGPLKLKKGSPLIVAFVGPTGSGKTTTLAKLAAHCRFQKNKKISIITADTYRIAAIEQIRTFADIVSVGLQVVFSPDEIPAALAACEGSDVIFVDTAGRSQRNKEHMEELRLLMDVLRPDETHLVLSATTKDSDLADMVEKYRGARINRLLFTKLDETSKLGNIFNAVSDLRIPVSYFTVGQSVPDDIELAQAGKFVKKLMEGRAL